MPTEALQDGQEQVRSAGLESGAVDPVVAMTFPLAEMRQAQEAFSLHRHVGKIVLTVAEQGDRQRFIAAVAPLPSPL